MDIKVFRIGDGGTSDHEFTIGSDEDLQQAKSLIQRSYEAS